MLSKLLKVFLKERFSLGRLFGQKISQSKVQSFLMVGLLVYAFGVTTFSNGFINYELALTLQSVDQINQLWVNLFAQLSGIGFLFGFFQAQGYLFQYKDFDLLGALPIKQTTIVTSKLMIMMIFVALFASIIALPIYVVWWIFTAPPIWHAVIFLGLFILTPIPLLIAGSIVSFVIRTITQRWLHAQVMQTIFSLLFVATFVALSTIDPQAWLPSDTFFTFQWVQDWFISAGAETNLLDWFLYVVTHLMITIGFVLIMSGPFLVINQNRQQATYQNKTKVPNKPRSVFQHFVMKEWRRFIGTSIYLLNTGFGALLMIALALGLMLFPDWLREFLIPFAIGNVEVIWIIFLLIGFMLATIYTPAISLSLEGKNFALLKTLPIQPMTIYQAKIVFNLWLMLPPLALAVIAFAIALNLPWLLVGLLLLALSLFAVLLSVFFLFVNLWFPRFDFQQEVEVVKQSLASLVAVFGGFAWLSLLGFLTLGLLVNLDILLQLITVILIEGLLIFFGYLWLQNYGKKRFETLTV
jgi:ABC-2 type transport system permease protein